MKRKILFISAAVLLLAAAAFILYAGIYYPADPSAAEALVAGGPVRVDRTDYGWFFDGPGTEDALIFYPGGKVDETAYAPFIRLLAEQGTDVCLVRMPFRLAILGINRADRVLSSHEYSRWFIGGHSLGGAAATMYASGHSCFSGVVLCAAYPARQLERDDLEILVYGSEDGVLNRERFEESRQYSSDHVEEFEIPGGNHAQFGCYGSQSGDGTASVSAADQQEAAARFITGCLREG